MVKHLSVILNYKSKQNCQVPKSVNFRVLIADSTTTGVSWQI